MPFNRLGELGTPLFRSGTNWVRRDSGLWVAEEPLNLKKDSYILKEGRSAYLYMGTLYYTSNGTFRKADYPGLRAVFVRMVGGGGAGGGAPNTSAGQSSGGDGGGGGGYREALIPAEALADEESVVVGQGGIGVARWDGGDGGPSSFGSHMTAGGGGGGIARAATSAVIKYPGSNNGGGGGAGAGFGVRGGNGDGPWLGAGNARGGRGGASQFGLLQMIPSNSNNTAGANSPSNNYG